MAPPSTPAGAKGKPGAAVASASAPPEASGPTTEELLKETLMGVARFFAIAFALFKSYAIRLYAVEVYGRVIHEFDPWFNFRATQYLVDHGAAKFFRWFDHSVWHPLGRPVGTTIYPGMQFTSAGIFRALRAAGFSDVTLNDVCVFTPAAFSVLACVFTGLIAREAAAPRHKATAFAVAVGVMAVLPAHLMRSVAGGYDNEAIAVTAIVGTFYWWIRSLRTQKSWPFAFVTAASYFYMVAAWGGYTFVLNMIGVHAGVSVLAGHFTWGLYKAYAVFYVLGTFLATRVPVVGMMPLQSMEQMGPLFVLFLLTLAAFCESRKRTLGEREYAAFLKRVVSVGLAASAFALLVAGQSGLVGGLSARVKGLFVPHTRTGNPLVDSVAEHQATQGDVYAQYFHFTVVAAPVGALACAFGKRRREPARLFVALYFFVAGYFSSKMVRLVLLLGPAAAAATGVSLGAVVEWVADEAATMAEIADEPEGAAAAAAASPAGGAPLSRAERKSAKKQRGGGGRASADRFRIDKTPELVSAYFRERPKVRKALAAVVVSVAFTVGSSFLNSSERMARSMSEPSIMIRGRAPTGESIILDDFREAYWWLRDNTPEDARVMAWWDYGYQINGVANRTTLADGNTWNHEHIALLGKCLVSPELEGHEIVRHLADYVLVWTTRFAGMPGDDLAKAPHMARIAGSVYDDVKQEGFYVDERGRPSESMRESLLFRLHSYGMSPDVEPLEKYEEVYASKYKMVRIWKVLEVDEESKRIAAEGGNRECDAGGWYCPGTYPAALEDVLSKKKDFKMVH
jgi:dolichyl-diphosphooligosaccharide--protein glycosyltransferase